MSPVILFCLLIVNSARAWYDYTANAQGICRGKPDGYHCMTVGFLTNLRSVHCTNGELTDFHYVAIDNPAWCEGSSVCDPETGQCTWGWRWEPLFVLGAVVLLPCLVIVVVNCIDMLRLGNKANADDDDSVCELTDSGTSQ